MGYILSFCYESCLIHKTPISILALENAALRYYTDVIEKNFLVHEHICKPFEDNISDEYQYDLLMKIINRQREINVILKRRRNKYLNYFYISSEIANLLDKSILRIKR